VNSNLVNASQRPNLPYTEATLHEIWRCGPVGPLAATRCARENTKIGNHIIYAGTVVFPNLYTMTTDPKVWGPDVDKFNPDRFLTTGHPKNNLAFKNDCWDFVFGTGRRKCLGESVARIENFLFFANLLKHFKLEIPNGCSIPTTRPKDGMTIGPQHFPVKFTQR
jgi:cytochrome P450